MKTVFYSVLSLSLFLGICMSLPAKADGTEDTRTWNYQECMEGFKGFYFDYGNYHYEGDGIVVDFAVQNPEEEAAQYCDYFFDRI